MFTVLVRVADTAGNVATMSKQIRLDRSGPKVNVGVANGSDYDLGKQIVVTFSATDATAVASVTAKLDATKALTSGGSISTNTLTAGTHTITVTATDALGNDTTVIVTFVIQVSTGGLQSAVSDGASKNLVDKFGRLDLEQQARLGPGRHQPRRQEHRPAALPELHQHRRGERGEEDRRGLRGTAAQLGQRHLVEALGA